MTQPPITADHIRALKESTLANAALVRHTDGRLEIISIPTPPYRIILLQERLAGLSDQARFREAHVRMLNEHEEFLAQREERLGSL